MKQYLKISMIVTFALIIFSCDKDNELSGKIFQVDSAQNLTVGKSGGEIFIPVTSTDNYVPMSSEPWCTIGEKTEDGFFFSVNTNALTTTRSVDVVVATVGFPFYIIKVTQEQGDPNFSIADEELNKTFAQAGGELYVTLATNIDYTVDPPTDTWCSISDITANGFKLTASPNDVTQRRTSITIHPNGDFPNVTIIVKQSGNAILQNGFFINNSMEHWTTSGTSGLFGLATDAYIAAGSPTGAYYLKNNISATSGFEGRVTQKLTNLTDGVYILSCQAAGYPGNSAATDGVYFIVIDKNGNETQQKMTLPGGGWKENSMQINVTGGECTIGIYAKAAGGSASTMSFKVMNFDFK